MREAASGANHPVENKAVLKYVKFLPRLCKNLRPYVSWAAFTRGARPSDGNACAEAASTHCATRNAVMWGELRPANSAVAGTEA